VRLVFSFSNLELLHKSVTQETIPATGCSDQYGWGRRSFIRVKTGRRLTEEDPFSNRHLYCTFILPLAATPGQGDWRDFLGYVIRLQRTLRAKNHPPLVVVSILHRLGLMARVKAGGTGYWAHLRFGASQVVHFGFLVLFGGGRVPERIREARMDRSMICAHRALNCL